MYAANAVKNVLCAHLVLTAELRSDLFAQGGMQSWQERYQNKPSAQSTHILVARTSTCTETVLQISKIWLNSQFKMQMLNVSLPLTCQVGDTAGPGGRQNAPLMMDLSLAVWQTSQGACYASFQPTLSVTICPGSGLLTVSGFRSRRSKPLVGTSEQAALNPPAGLADALSQTCCLLTAKLLSFSFSLSPYLTHARVVRSLPHAAFEAKPMFVRSSIIVISS